MDVILGWLPKEGEAFLFHRPVNLGKAGDKGRKFSNYSFIANVAENLD